MFQSTHPHGVRLMLSISHRKHNWFQSTHPHGVRLTYLSSEHMTMSFNPRTHMGCDPFGKLSYVEVSEFQSTHPHGVRLTIEPSSLRVGDVSIHAPTWGATNCRTNPTRTRTSFNPRTHMGCDILNIITFTNRLCFNPRTHMGCD